MSVAFATVRNRPLPVAARLFLSVGGTGRWRRWSRLRGRCAEGVGDDRDTGAVSNKEVEQSPAVPVLETERLLLRPWRATEAVVQRRLWEERDPRAPAHRRIDAQGVPRSTISQSGSD
jgi:hypothetical protein